MADFQTVKDLLESSILYASASVSLKTTNPSGLETKSYADVPYTLWLWCDDSECSKAMHWDASSGRDSAPKVWFTTPHRYLQTFTYYCRHTPKVTATFALMPVLGQQPAVHLVGRFPRARPHLDETLRAVMGEIDQHLYTHALECRAVGRGIGALTYVRRVLEREMEGILDRLADALIAKEMREAADAVLKLKTRNEFSEKAKAADALLPPSFFPGQQNPFARLHDLTSEGVHILDDVESCQRFDETRDLFELLVMKLIRDAESERLYVDKAKKLPERAKR